MEPGPATPPALRAPPAPPALPEPPKPKAAGGCAWQSLRCLRLRRQKKKVAYSAHIHKLLNQTSSTGDSCPLPAVLACLGSPWLLGAVALEAARLCRGCRLRQRQLLLATELVLLRELHQPPPGS